MSLNIQNYGYKTKWNGIRAEERETTYPVMSDYHAHDFYEISLISSGSVSVFTPEISFKTDGACIILLPPENAALRHLHEGLHIPTQT